MSYENLVFEKQGQIGLVTLKREGKMNALSSGLINDLASVLDNEANDPDVRALVITGHGRAFCAGADISEVVGLSSGADFYKWVKNIQRMCLKLEDFPKPVIAAVNGAAMGGGCELSLACDIRIASSSAAFAVPEINIGVLPGAGGMSRLPRIVGVGRAKELIYTGRRVSGEEAYQIGLVNKVVAPEDLMPEAMNLAAELATKPPISLAAGKSTVNATAETDIKTGAEIEAKAVAMVFDTADRKEGMTAFLEKRKPVFVGR